MGLLTSIRAGAHYLDQTAVISAAQKAVSKYGLYGFTGGIFAWDMITAKPEERKEHLIRDVLVLGPSLLATRWGIKRMSEPAAYLPAMSEMNPKMLKEIRQVYGKSLGKLLDRNLNKVIKEAIEVENPHYAEHVHKARDFFKFSEIKKMIETVKSSNHPNAKKHLEAMFPLPAGEHEDSVVSYLFTPLLRGKLPSMPTKELIEHDHMLKFFTTGAGIVATGIAGGFANNVAKGVREKSAYVNMVKEGLFQFIANIALCAVGASIGVTVADASGLSKMAQKSGLAKFLKGGTILAGLCIGILGGGKAANWMANHYINPFFEWMDKRHQGASFGDLQKKWVKLPPDRKVEFMDGVLHLDDLPTAAALAGVQFVVPFIPLFFEVSALRSGFGYRSKGIQQGLHNNATEYHENLKSAGIPKATPNAASEAHAPAAMELSAVRKPVTLSAVQTNLMQSERPRIPQSSGHIQPFTESPAAFRSVMNQPVPTSSPFALTVQNVTMYPGMMGQNPYTSVSMGYGYSAWRPNYGY